MELILDQCTVRSWRREDAASLACHANSYNIWRNLRDQFPHPYTDADARAWLRYATRQEPETNFAIDVGGAAVGGIGFTIQADVHRLSAELGYWLGETLWGRGIATEAVQGITAYAADRFGLCRLFAGVFETNAASVRVLQKAGYVLEGRLRRSVLKEGRKLDQFLYAWTAGSAPEQGEQVDA
jgi:ribosomal-protein-alanine N-acetyltransferase